MNMIPIKKDNSISTLITQIRTLVEEARRNVARNINKEILQTYWQIGKHIVEFEQKGNIKAEYGKQLLINLSKELSIELGKGFSRSNLTYMRLFYIYYRKGETVSHQLSWSHYFELLKIDDDLERNFYQKQSIKENWSVRELKRHKTSALFQRLALSKEKNFGICVSL
jgi:predicted nuclease of restriction endonuclease-like (RecB) superfamily